MKDSSFWVLQLSAATTNPSTSTLECVAGFRTPDLFCLLKGKSHLRTERTFLSAPHPFNQSIVTVVFDEQAELCTPALHALVTGKLYFFATLDSTPCALAKSGKVSGLASMFFIGHYQLLNCVLIQFVLAWALKKHWKMLLKTNLKTRF